MGYLSQKKRQTRENIFLTVMAVLITTVTFGSLSNSGFRIVFFNLFHLYCISGILFFYAIFISKYKAAAAFALLWLVNYTSLSSSANIFLSDKFNGSQSLELIFDRQKSLLETFNGEDITSAGNIILAGRYSAAYAVIQKETPLTVIRVDLEKLPLKESPLIFKHLQDVISQMNTPVIVFGNFGQPVWNRPFKQFLDTCGLSVKNRLLFTKGCPFNVFSSPDFYVLGFREMGITDILIKGSGKNKVIRIDLSFNPAQP